MSITSNVSWCMSSSPNYSVRNAGKSVRRLCLLIQKRLLTRRGFAVFSVFKRFDSRPNFPAINQIKMMNIGRGEMGHKMGKIEISASCSSWKKINFSSSETRKFCPVNLFTNEWLHNPERSVENEHSCKLFRSVLYLGYPHTQMLLGLVTRDKP